MTEKEMTPEDIQAYKKELEDIKTEKMREELEEIKKERMRQELSEIKREREKSGPRYVVTAQVSKNPWPAIAVLLSGALLLVAAGFILGNMFGTNTAEVIDEFIKGYGLPVGGNAILISLAIILGFGGLWILSSLKL